jgi:hypothetical protein
MSVRILRVMALIIVASEKPRCGRSTIAAALAYRFARDGKRVTLARLDGDDSAVPDAAAFALLEPIVSPGSPVGVSDLTPFAAAADVAVVEAPAGSVRSLVGAHEARVIVVGRDTEGPVDARDGQVIGTMVTCVPQGDVAALRERPGVLAALPEDRALAAPSARDIASALKARWLVENENHGAIERVMIGTVASDAASPYFANRARTCVVTRYDKTDIQLAALLTDLELLVLTGGGEPSPYLLDRVANSHDGVSVLLSESDTVDAMRSIESLYGRSRFEGQGKLERAVALLDDAGVTIDI